MKAVVVHGPGDIRYDDLPLPSPGPEESDWCTGQAISIDGGMSILK